MLSIMDEWLALLLHIWEVPGSNLGWKTSYPEVIHDFPVPPGKYWDNTLN
jgi:hypothetical protein